MPQPIDTSTLGPIRVETTKEAMRAKVVRDALVATSEFASGLGKPHVAADAINLAQAPDVILAKLGRMLRG